MSKQGTERGVGSGLKYLQVGHVQYGKGFHVSEACLKCHFWLSEAPHGSLKFRSMVGTQYGTGFFGCGIYIKFSDVGVWAAGGVRCRAVVPAGLDIQLGSYLVKFYQPSINLASDSLDR
jgi:hypothetical protein